MSARPPLQLADLTKRAPEVAAVQEPAPDELVYLSARVPKVLRTELQMEAVRQCRPLAQLIQEAVRAYLDRSDT